jgi:RNA polymerase-binding transcription factor DksA
MVKATPNQNRAGAAPKKSAVKTPVAKKPIRAKNGAAKAVATKKLAAKTVVAKKKAAPGKAAPGKKSAVASKAAVKKQPPAKTAAPVKKSPPKSAPKESQEKATLAPAAKRAAVAKKAAPAEKAAPAKKAVRKTTTVICPLSGFEVKPEKPNLSPRALERLEAQLREERARHVEQADIMAAEAELLASEREGGDTQFDEESGEGDTINIERERDLLLSASANQIVDDIDRALERIAEGTYGVCVPAGRRISLERLDALPYAETCVDCKARAERRR